MCIHLGDNWQDALKARRKGARQVQSLPGGDNPPSFDFAQDGLEPVEGPIPKLNNIIGVASEKFYLASLEDSQYNVSIIYKYDNSIIR